MHSWWQDTRQYAIPRTPNKVPKADGFAARLALAVRPL
jgi:hypothetical protein